MISFIFLTSLSAQARDPSEFACFRFRVHLNAELPPVPSKKKESVLPAALQKKIAQWENELTFLKDLKARQDWISCIKNFIFLDSDKDGIADWTAIVDGKPSRILFPQDIDLDGDGINNVMDSNPYELNKKKEELSIPLHLSLQGDGKIWQEKIFQDFGILALNHSDLHHPQLLKIIYSLLKLNTFKNLKGNKPYKYIYAMKARNPLGQIAAFHPTADAISIPGESSFGKQLDENENCKISSALLHETGHAFLFKSVSADALADLVNQHGNWDLEKHPGMDIWDKKFQLRHEDESSQFVSEYAKTNVHEWFAENFAAYLWEINNFDKTICKAFQNNKIPSVLSNWFALKLSNQNTNQASNN